MLERLSKTSEPAPSSRAWAELIVDKEAHGISCAPAKRIAESCDLIDPIGPVDALDALNAVGAEARDILLTPDLFFPDVCEGLRHGGSIAKRDQAEYARLVARQL